MKNNYDKLQTEQIKNEVIGKENKPSLLLHSCCAPCLTACIERVVDFFKVTVYFYNPNITSASEYEKRLNELKNFLNAKYLGSRSCMNRPFGHKKGYARQHSLFVCIVLRNMFSHKTV